jgi:hypothetical protein
MLSLESKRFPALPEACGRSAIRREAFYII